MGRVNVLAGENSKRTTILIADDLEADLRQLARERGEPTPGALLTEALRGVPRGEMSTRAEAWIREQIAAQPMAQAECQAPPADRSSDDARWPPARRIAEAMNAARGLPTGRTPARWLEDMIGRLPEAARREIAGLRDDAALAVLAGAVISQRVGKYLAAPLRTDAQMAEELALDVDTFRAAIKHDPQLMRFAVHKPDWPRRWPAFIVHPYWQGSDLWKQSNVWGQKKGAAA